MRDFCDKDPEKYGNLLSLKSLWERLKIEATYDHAVVLERFNLQELRRDLALKIPENFDYFE